MHEKKYYIYRYLITLFPNNNIASFSLKYSTHFAGYSLALYMVGAVL